MPITTSSTLSLIAGFDPRSPGTYGPMAQVCHINGAGFHHERRRLDFVLHAGAMFPAYTHSVGAGLSPKIKPVPTVRHPGTIHHAYLRQPEGTPAPRSRQTGAGQAGGQCHSPFPLIAGLDPRSLGAERADGRPRIPGGKRADGGQGDQRQKRGPMPNDISPQGCYLTGSKKVSGLPGSKTSLQYITVTRSSVSERLMMLWV